MTNTLTYTVTLSDDGHYQVAISGDDPQQAVDEALAWAKGFYLKLQAFSDEKRRGTPPEGEPPVCPIHEQPMTWQQGRKGFFWSCHNRLDDGSWCDYKPAEAV